MGSLHEGGNGSNQNCSEQETQTKVLDVNVTKNIAQEVHKLKSKELVLERRVSPRLKNIPKDKRPYYGSDCRRQSVSLKDYSNDRKMKLNSLSDNGRKKKAKVDYSIKDCLTDVSRKDVEDKGTKSGSAIIEPADTEIVDLEDEAYLKWTDYEAFLADTIHQKAINRVKETIRIFNKHSLHFAQEEMKRCEQGEVNDEQIDNGTRNNGSPLADNKRSNSRTDFKAITEMKNKKEVLYPEKMIGHLPGIVVGHQFTSRTEMVAIGFHGHWMNGIDYISKFSGKLKQRCGYTCPLAVAIVMSGQYEDDVDCLNEVVYTGQGGNDLHGSKHQIKDQVMHRGNLALKVVNHWAEKGISGHNVFKYRLRRLLGQPKVDIDQVHYERERKPGVSPRLPGLVCEDISYGEEDIHIPVTNVIDYPPIAPAGFKYTKFVQVSKNITVPPSASGCSCKGQCTNQKSCSCAQLNGSDFPYVSRDGGRLIEPKDVVFECGPQCSCRPNCTNRVSQRQLKYRLEVYRVENKGWAVRSWDFIPSGAPVCEYAGILRRNDELDNVSENDYIFDIDCWHTMNGIGGREKRQGDGSAPTSDLAEKEDDKMTESESEFCIDAGSCGNVARFINHSCEPNLFVQCVLSSHHDIRFARVVLVAADNIPPMQELTYDYGYALDSVIGPDGKIKQAPCFCGTSECRGRLY
ncbi:histone-lysine N-methyltransferase, H3 lysine-9 specific SUVH4 isoform X2 [Hevea brasiliensis]|uniref:histone-lysine N-methyltransferase, H3 lysine-9 specific SUVH4 isoform X2 n=1 Tax=Hevea brasiliensis TaxID=3981 RepID=UPI0025DC8179|nr:histone-lysine N-methyltransferase, H3 lysine-9 specific SUVH4 isoform X2 [Hevea brasiliensis]